MAQPVVRLTANVDPAVAASLEKLAALLGTTKTEALNQAITTTAALYEASADGGQLILKQGNTQRIVNLAKQHK